MRRQRRVADDPISCTWYTLDGQARGGCCRRGSRRFGCRRRDAGNGEDAGPEEEEEDPGGGGLFSGGSWFGSSTVDSLDACEKGETCQAEPWLGGLWGSKMVLLFVLLNFSDGLIDDETDVVAALFCCCCVAALSCMAVALGQTI